MTVAVAQYDTIISASHNHIFNATGFWNPLNAAKHIKIGNRINEFIQNLKKKQKNYVEFDGESTCLCEVTTPHTVQSNGGGYTVLRDTERWIG